MFTTLLIANRGEIACRIIKTARHMGIRTVAIYSTADKDSLHVQKADSAFCVGGAPSKDSYLNIDAIIQAAIASGAEAIHPGYGFLSENADFARACEKNGLIFIGPSIDAIQIMGSKQWAKKQLEQTEVPLTPGYHETNQGDAHLLEEAKRIGFPVLIKAALGGGGRGMRAVLKEQDFQEALQSARREAKASFGDDTLILEKLIVNARHIEVQIMADNHGNVVHLFERDCSIQRRHQKVIEEAPAPNISETLREKLTKAACNVARAIDYRGAGTIEFLVDTVNEQFYFMEMNTRLQVEHPVTELITGLDLVAWQIKIAANEPLPLAQAEIQRHGHAIECRIYAEDPAQNFMPSIGQITFLEEPVGSGIRLDSGITCFSNVTPFYDSMVSKLIAFGDNREQTCMRLEQALQHYYIDGIHTNIPFLQAILSVEAFKNAKLSTRFLEEETIAFAKEDNKTALILAASHDYLKTLETQKDPLMIETFGFQSNLTSQWHPRYLIDGEIKEACIRPIDTHSCTIEIDEEILTIHGSLQGSQLKIEDGIHTISASCHTTHQYITVFTASGKTRVHRFFWETQHNPTQKGQLTAPMPATVVAILKNLGDAVVAGEGLMVLEAMKMEHTICAPTDGILKSIYYPLGAQVQEGAELLALEDS